MNGLIHVRGTAKLVYGSADVTEVDDVIKGPIGRVEVDAGLAGHGRRGEGECEGEYE